MKNNHNVITFLRNNNKVITQKYCNYKIDTLLHSNYNIITHTLCNNKIITKTLLSYIVITFFSSANALTFHSDLIDGSLIRGQTDQNESVFVEESYLNIGKNSNKLFKIPTDSSGKFFIAVPQDATELTLTVKKENHSEQKTFSIKPRSWDEEYVTGLPPAKVSPNTKNQARITQESLQMRQARQTSVYPGFPNKWICPVPDYTRISSHFGSRRILNNVKKQGHSGTDLAAPVGTKIIAPADGKVVFIHPDMFLTGQTILIDHGMGVFSSYSHLSSIKVKLNQIVKSGDLIGLVGQTGRATGPHLHWTITWYGVRVNPEDFIDIK